jgi:hypothetical protein
MIYMNVKKLNFIKILLIIILKKKKKKNILFVLQVMLIMTNILATCVTRISQDFRSLYHHVNLYQLEERPY